MKIKETKIQQSERLKEISIEKNVDYISLNLLLNSVKTKKLHSRRNYHQQTIDDTINKAVK
jgi:hypothetical protein